MLVLGERGQLLHEMTRPFIHVFKPVLHPATMASINFISIKQDWYYEGLVQIVFHSRPNIMPAPDPVQLSQLLIFLSKSWCIYLSLRGHLWSTWSCLPLQAILYEGVCFVVANYHFTLDNASFHSIYVWTMSVGKASVSAIRLISCANFCQWRCHDRRHL